MRKRICPGGIRDGSLGCDARRARQVLLRLLELRSLQSGSESRNGDNSWRRGTRRKRGRRRHMLAHGVQSDRCAWQRLAGRGSHHASRNHRACCFEGERQVVGGGKNRLAQGYVARYRASHQSFPLKQILQHKGAVRAGHRTGRTFVHHRSTHTIDRRAGLKRHGSDRLVVLIHQVSTDRSRLAQHQIEQDLPRVGRLARVADHAGFRLKANGRVTGFAYDKHAAKVSVGFQRVMPLRVRADFGHSRRIGVPPPDPVVAGPCLWLSVNHALYGRRAIVLYPGHCGTGRRGTVGMQNGAAHLDFRVRRTGWRCVWRKLRKRLWRRRT